ncbi:MAG: hypothetical protein ACYDC1_03650, partial [Limisphaerales bacterium]
MNTPVNYSSQALRRFVQSGTMAGLLFFGCPAVFPAEAPVPVEVKSASVEGQLDGDKARLVIQADLGSLGGERARAIDGAAIHQRVNVTRDQLTQTFALKVDAIQGGLRDVVFALGGDG